jgi:hypothetical protein
MTNINPALTALIDPADFLAVAEALAVLEPVADDPVVVAAEPDEPVVAELPEPVTPKSANVPFLHSLMKSWSS